MNRSEVMFTTSQVAEMFGVKRVTVLKWITRGLLPAEKFGSNWAIAFLDVATFQKPKTGRPPHG